MTYKDKIEWLFLDEEEELPGSRNMHKDVPEFTLMDTMCGQYDC